MITTYPEIPAGTGQVDGWKDIPIRKNGQPDPLVPLGQLSREATIVTTSSLYFGEHSNSPYSQSTNKLEASLLTVFARWSVAHRLVVAERLLPAGYHLLVFDAYRSYHVQKSLYDFYKQKLGEKYPGMSDGALGIETQNYVSLPSTDPTRPSPHNTGGAVDVAVIKLNLVHEEELARIRFHLADDTLDFAKRVGLEMRLSAVIRRHGKMLDFGTPFDHGGEKSALCYYENKIISGQPLTNADMTACNSRRLLYSVMTQAGFLPYFAEWWHFNAPESQMGAAAAGYELATLGATVLDESNMAHETTRRMIRDEALKLYGEKDRMVAPTVLKSEIAAVIRDTGDPRLVNDWPAEIIAPPGE